MENCEGVTVSAHDFALDRVWRGELRNRHLGISAVSHLTALSAAVREVVDLQATPSQSTALAVRSRLALAVRSRLGPERSATPSSP